MKNPSPEDLRFERKYIVTSDLYSPEMFIRTHPAGFREVYPPRQVNSIYFDDLNYSSWADSESGCFERRKIRVRWYGQIMGSCPTSLEIKAKLGHLGWKRVYPLNKPICDLISDLFCSHWIRKQKLPSDLRIHLTLLRPVLMNSYSRRYYLSRDKRYRLTLDQDITYFKPARKGAHTELRPMRDPLPTVLELKYPRSLDQGADDIAQSWPFRLSRKSKYTSGMELIHTV